jgi:uroporphyrinogen decarboxylase
VDGPVPIWLMRQAGRYLPEYRKLREQAGDFLNLCYSPELAADVTLQPVRRFGFDAAILFSDILVVPDGLGQKVWFVAGEGPRLEPLSGAKDLAKLDPAKIEVKLAPVFETVSRVKSELDDKTALIGFCGAPWTVATYMIAGEGTKEQAPARLWAYKDRGVFTALIDLLVESSVIYLKGQIKAGAEVLQIFDSWAGSLTEGERDAWCLSPIERIARAVKADHPEIPIIGFLRGAPGANVKLAGMDVIDGVGIDSACDLEQTRREVQSRNTVQGNLDPIALLAGGKSLDVGIDLVLDKLGAGPHIFNLGHGILPNTPIGHVAHLVERVRAYSKENRGV